MIDPIVFGRWVEFTNEDGRKGTMSEGEWIAMFKPNTDDSEWAKLGALMEAEFMAKMCGL